MAPHGDARVYSEGIMPRPLRMEGTAPRLRHNREEAQLNLARDLHDLAGWHLAALNYGLSAAERDPGNQAKLHEVRRRLEALSEALRRLTSYTRARRHLRIDLMGELAVLTDKWTGFTGIPVVLRGMRGSADLPEDTDSTVIAIVQEALINVAKHASTSTCVTVAVRGQATHLTVLIMDDCSEFDATCRLAVVGHGIEGMRERSALIGGTVQVRRRRSGGTSVILVVPRQVRPPLSIVHV